MIFTFRPFIYCIRCKVLLSLALYYQKFLKTTNMRNLIFNLAGMLMIIAGMSACKKETPDYSRFYPNALVTVKTTEGGICYLQLDDKTTLKPTNMDKSPFGEKEVRALVNYTDEGKPENNSLTDFDRTVKINWIDSILTKMPVMTAGEENDSKYGTAPIEIINNWTTIVEDGYITLCFYGIWGRSGRPHILNLLTGTDPEDPYTLELRHDANGDDSYYGREVTGLVAFNIRELPDTKGETVDLKLKIKSFSGDKTITFKYCTGKTTEKGASISYKDIDTGIAVR